MAKSQVKQTVQERVAAMSKQDLVELVAYLFGYQAMSEVAGHELLDTFKQDLAEMEYERAMEEALAN
jgi:tRNA A37 N6-isopentenylltransferase MiaA